MVYVILVGHYAGFIFLYTLRDWYVALPATQYPISSPPIPPGFIGLLERLIFTVVVGFLAPLENGELGSILAAMGGWLGLKLISGWNRAPSQYRYQSKKEADEALHNQARGAMASLLAGIVNLSFALVAGLIASGVLQHDL